MVAPVGGDRGCIRHLQHMRTQRYLEMQAVHLTTEESCRIFSPHTGIELTRASRSMFPVVRYDLCKYCLHFHADFSLSPLPLPFLIPSLPSLIKMVHVRGNSRWPRSRYLFTPVNRLASVTRILALLSPSSLKPRGFSPFRSAATCFREGVRQVRDAGSREFGSFSFFVFFNNGVWCF